MVGCVGACGSVGACGRGGGRVWGHVAVIGVCGRGSAPVHRTETCSRGGNMW